MKKFLFFTTAMMFAGIASAQTGTPEKKEENNSTKKEERTLEVGIKEEKTSNEHPRNTNGHHSKFECPKCHMTSDKPGKCTMCKVDMLESKDEMKKEKMEKKEGKHDGSGGGHRDGKKRE